MTTDKATARPWHVMKQGHPDMEYSVWIDADDILKPALASTQANANLIVKAVNSYEAMREALELILRQIELIPDNEVDRVRHYQWLKHEAEKALAEGGDV